jgi:hypothetical protein
MEDGFHFVEIIRWIGLVRLSNDNFVDLFEYTIQMSISLQACVHTRHLYLPFHISDLVRKPREAEGVGI